jgi:hypothetical protein
MISAIMKAVNYNIYNRLYGGQYHIIQIKCDKIFQNHTLALHSVTKMKIKC